MPKINLAQETMRNQVIAKRRRVVYFLSTVLLVLVAGVYLTFLFLSKNVENKTEEIQQRIENLEAQLRAREPLGRDIKAFRSRLVNLDKLLKNHVRWSLVFTELERLILPNTVLSSIKGGADGKDFAMKVSVPNVDAAADLVVSLENSTGKNNTQLSKVSSTGLVPVQQKEGVASAGFTTTLKFEVKKEAFLLNSEL